MGPSRDHHSLGEARSTTDIVESCNGDGDHVIEVTAGLIVMVVVMKVILDTMVV